MGDVVGGRVESRLKELGMVQISGTLVYCSGHGCEDIDGKLRLRGKVGADLTLEQGYAAARNCALNMLASLKQTIGSLERIERVLKVTGFVNSDPQFDQQPAVMHGFSDLMNDLFEGKHARSAVGTNVLPNNQAVEVEMIAELKAAPHAD
jgi:6-phosphogluconolactonase